MGTRVRHGRAHRRGAAHGRGELYPLQGRSLAVLHIRTAEETGKAVSQAQVETLGKESQGMTQPG